PSSFVYSQLRHGSRMAYWWRSGRLPPADYWQLLGSSPKRLLAAINRAWPNSKARKPKNQNPKLHRLTAETAEPGPTHQSVGAAGASVLRLRHPRLFQQAAAAP